jgi:hypothetical protein
MSWNTWSPFVCQFTSRVVSAHSEKARHATRGTEVQLGLRFIAGWVRSSDGDQSINIHFVDRNLDAW